jgi:hypothetical protein
MKRFILILSLLAVLFSLPLSAKSVKKGMLMSALLPGSGEIYAGNLGRGIFFITADLAILFQVNRYGSQASMFEENFKQYAYTTAGIPKDRSDSYYELIHNWQSSDEYNAYYEMVARNYFLLMNYDPEGYNEYISTHYYGGEDAWKWQQRQEWIKYKYIRRDRNAMIMNRKLAIGAAIANRVISVIDAAYLVNSGNKRYKTSFNVVPSPDYNGAIINCSLEF